MKGRDVFTRLLVILGTVLVWLPVLAPLAFGAVRLVQGRRLLIDYFMPAELLPVVVVGGLLLFWAAFRMRSRRWLIGGSLAAGLVLLFGGQGVAVATGLASGEAEPAGWPWLLTMGMILLYDLLVIVVGVGGVLLLMELFKAPKPEAQGA